METMFEKEPLERKLFQGYITLNKRNPSQDVFVEGEGCVEVIGKTAIINFAKKNCAPSELLKVSLDDYVLFVKHYCSNGFIKL
ncbi:MAG: hypothetical protein QXT19_05110 [Candidatus Woesearchaeota archaeon]